MIFVKNAWNEDYLNNWDNYDLQLQCYDKGLIELRLFNEDGRSLSI